MNFSVSIQIPDFYDLTPEQIKAILTNNLWWYVQSLEEGELKPTKTFNKDVKVFVAQIKVEG